MLQFLTSKNAVVQSHTPTFPSFQFASASATIACHFGWAPLQDFPIFTTQLCKTSPQITSKRHDMDYQGHTKGTIDIYRCYGHLVLEICSASNSRILAKIALPPMKKLGHKMCPVVAASTTLKPNPGPNGPVASINGWLQCPGGNFEHRSDMIRP